MMEPKLLRILKQSDFKTSNWSGGKTKQLYIYPQSSDYSKRNFSFRISIATTQLESSVFTKLQNVDRVISILQGKMDLEHKNQYSKTLLPFEIDRFKGEWDTSAKGKVTDFNLMLKSCKGDFYFKEINNEQTLKLGDSQSFLFLYCIVGKIIVNNELINKGQLIIVKKSQFKVNPKEFSKIFYGFVSI